MKSLVKFTIKQNVFINVLFMICLAGGVFSILSIPLENLPTVDIGKIIIHTTYFGASAEDVEQLVTIKIEDAIDGLENVEFVQSYSFRNFSSIIVKFIDDADYKDLYDELRFRILNTMDELPEEADEPFFIYLDTHEWVPVVMVNIAGEIPQRSLKLYSEELKTKILNISGVRSVELIGEYDYEFHVSIDPEKLRKYGITFNQAAEAIESANTKIPTGRFKTQDTEYMLDAGKKLSSQEEVLKIIVKSEKDGTVIRVRDIVTNARLSYRDPSEIPSINGEDALRLKVIKEESGNSVTICEKVKKISKEFEKLHEADGIKVYFNLDSTLEINDSVKTLGGNLILGMSLVLTVLWISLGFRNAMMAAIGIPFAFLCSVVIMHFAGVSLNTISLFSFVLVTGIMVDDAVIIIENIFRHIQMGKSRINAVIDGTAEVFIPVCNSALTTALAFLPMLIMSGSTGEFFSQIPKTVTYALIASIFEALFILPIHVLDWGPKTQMIHDEDNEDPFLHLRKGIFSPIWKIYHWAVTKLLNHKFLALTSIFILFIAAMAILVLSATGIMPLIKVKFFPGNYFRYHVAVTMPTGTPIETTDLAIKEMSRLIMSYGENQAQSASGAAGYYSDEDYTMHSGNNYGEIVVTLPEDKDRNFPENPKNDPMQHLEFMRKVIREHINEKYGNNSAKLKFKVFEESDGPPTGKPVNIRITGLTMQHAMNAADLILNFLRENPEMTDLTELTDDRPENHKTAKFLPNQEKILEYGLMPGQVTAMVAGALNGYNVGKYRTIDEEIDLMVRLARKSDKVNLSNTGLANPYDVLEIPVIEHSDSPVLLRDLVDINYVYEPGVRARYKGRPTVTISSNLKPGSQLSPARIQVLVNKYYQNNLTKFQNISISYGGEFESTSKSYSSLTFAFFIAIMLIYMVLASQFNDYFQPVIIISAVPFALIGVVMGLFFSRTTFTIGSFMAIIGLAGVAVNDSLLMIEFMNTKIKENIPRRKAIIEACAARMRPVLITTITTFLGLLPMAIGIPNKSIAWAPMATAFVAGLSSATILALLIIPVEYELFEQIKIRFKKKSNENYS